MVETKSGIYDMILKEYRRKDYHDKFEHNLKLALQASHFVIQERIDHASKYPEQNLAQKYMRQK